MTPEDYPRWAEERLGIAPQPIASLQPDTPVARNDPAGAFRCDPFACQKVCCTGWPEGQGIRLTVMDLLRLDRAGFLDGTEGTFAPPEAIAKWRADPEHRPKPDGPCMRSVDGHCIHYDVETRRCGIWEHRPLICRTFPYAVDWVRTDGTVHVTFAGGCSLVQPAADQTPIARGENVPRTYLAIARHHETIPLGGLNDYEREHVEAYVQSAEEQARTLDLVTGHPEALDTLGLSRFRSPPERS